MARPKKDIDEETVRKLAAIDCSYAEIAAVVGCDPSTLTRRFAQVIEKGREDGCASLKRKQFEVAQSGNPTMLIWLGKQRLGQKDQQEQQHSGGITVRVIRRERGHVNGDNGTNGKRPNRLKAAS
jgi:hypothetical protein